MELEKLKRIEFPAKEKVALEAGVLFETAACIQILAGHATRFATVELLFGAAAMAFGGGEMLFGASRWRWVPLMFSFLLLATGFVLSIR